MSPRSTAGPRRPAACQQARRLMHAWLDTTGAPMPPAVGEHLRACCDCLAALSAWNRTELALRDLDGCVRVPPAPTAAAILARCARPRTVPWYVLPPRTARLAAAGVLMALAAFALWWAAPLGGPHPRGLDAMAVGARTSGQAAPAGAGQAEGRPEIR